MAREGFSKPSRFGLSTYNSLRASLRTTPILRRFRETVAAHQGPRCGRTG